MDVLRNTIIRLDLSPRTHSVTLCIAYPFLYLPTYLHIVI